MSYENFQNQKDKRSMVVWAQLPVVKFFVATYLKLGSNDCEALY